MSNYPWAKLQIFAGEGAPAGEGGAEASGENTAAAGQQERLLELGVPRDKLPKGRLRTNTGAGAPSPGSACCTGIPFSSIGHPNISAANIRSIMSMSFILVLL